MWVATNLGRQTVLFVTLVVSGIGAGLYRYRRRPHFCVIPRNGILPGSGKNVVICKSQFLLLFVFKLDARTLEAGLEKSGSNSLTILTTYYIHIDILNISCFLFLLRCFNKKGGYLL